MHVATLILVPVMAIFLLLAAVRGTRLFRSWRESRDADAVGQEDRDLLALADEKQRLLVALGDLEHEYALGKVSEDDYTGLKGYFEAEAVRVIKLLEAHEEASR